jgi:DNA-binding transcriptional regulator YiaG
MMRLAAAILGSTLTVAFAAAPAAGSKTCRNFDAAYRANLDLTADAVRHYQSCLSQTTAQDACSSELSDLRTAQEILQASFSTYAKACASTLVRWDERHPISLALNDPVGRAQLNGIDKREMDPSRAD